MGSSVTRHRKSEQISVISAPRLTGRRAVNAAMYPTTIKPPSIKNTTTNNSKKTSAVGSINNSPTRTRSPSPPPIIKRPKSPPPPLAPPPPSCLVRPKYSVNSTRNISPQSLSTSSRATSVSGGAANCIHVPPSIPVAPQVNDDTFDLQSELSSSAPETGAVVASSLLLAKDTPISAGFSGNNNNNNNNSGEKNLMESSFDSNFISRDHAGSNPHQKSSSHPFKMPPQADERSTKSFIEYIAQHALDLRSSRDLLWFNIRYDRRQLRRREHCAITWNPVEEIAINETVEIPKEEEVETIVAAPTPPTVATTTTIAVSSAKTSKTKTTTGIKTKTVEEGLERKKRKSINEVFSTPEPQSEQEERKEQEQQQQSPPTKPRIRPILAGNLPHREQLAKKALEDNFIFIYSRTPKRY